MAINDFSIDAEQIDKATFGEALVNVEEQQEEAEVQRLNAEAAASQVENEVGENQVRKAEGDPTKDEQAKLERKDDPNTPEHEDLDENDPRRDGVGWNLGDAWAEVQAAGLGGARDTVSSALTLPERINDMFNGEMVEQGVFNYKPDWDPLGGDLNPITKTWWGGMLRGLVHFGTTAAAITAGVATLPFTGKAALATGIAAKGATKIGYLQRLQGLRQIGTGALGWKKAMAFDAGIGAASDIVSEYSQDDNAMGVLKQQFPALDTPLATNDQDHPAVMTAKNVAEGLGIGAVAGGLLMVLGKAAGGKFKGKRIRAAGDGASRAQSKRIAMEGRAKEVTQLELDLPQRTPADRAADTMAANRLDVAEQIKEEGTRQLELPGFGGYKNKPLADDDMGTALPRGRVHTVMKQLDEIDNNGFDGDLGSTYATVTPAQMRRSNEIVDVDGKTYEEVMRRMLGEDRFARLIQEAADNNMNAREVFRSSYKRMQDLIENRNKSGLSPEEFWKPLDDEMDRFGGIDAWTMKNVVTADLVNASLFKEMRDYALVSREGKDVFDVWDTDGPVAAIRDRFIYGMSNVKKARMLISGEFRKLRTVEGEAKANKVLKERLQAAQQESEEALDMMLKVAQETKSGPLGDALLEAFSMSNAPRNWEDLEEYFNSRLRGGDYKGKNTPSMVVKELQGVMVNSILSGPKTPVKAVMGTTIAGFSRPLAQALGGLFTMDGRQMQLGLAASSAMVEALPEAWKVFKTKLNSYWAGDMSTIKTRFSNYEKRNADWEAMGEWIMREGNKNDGQKAAYLLGNMARGLNDNSLLTYSSKLMQSTDDAFGHIMARARARMDSMQKAWAELSEGPAGTLPIVDKNFMRKYEENFMKKYTNADGTINWDQSAALKYAQEEATLTRDLSGFTKGMEQLFARTPWAKPFFLFARTGVNGLELTAKHMPGFNMLVKDERRIANASYDMANSGKLLDIGIENGQQLDNAKAIQKGRMVMGTSLVTMASMFFMTDRLTGNGPMNTAQKKTWMAAGWQPRSIKLGDVWVSYDSFEPFNSILSHVADVGDNSELMGPEWTEQRLQRLATVLAQGTVSKSYLSGLSQLVELFNNPNEVGKVAANLANNQIPMGGLRNELGKLFNPYMKELNSDLASSIRNRNQLTELIAGGNKLPIKYDFLSGEPIKNHSFVTRMFNMFSPVQLNVQNSPGRTMLFNSGYDLNIAVYANPDGVNLKDYPDIRSEYQQAMGEQNLEAELNELASRPDVQESLKQMERDRNAGFIGKEPKTYLVNQLIAGAIRRAQKKAWAKVALDPKVQRLIRAQQKIEASQLSQRDYPDAANDRYQEAQELLNMPK